MRKTVFLLLIICCVQTIFSCCKSNLNFRWTKAVLTNLAITNAGVVETQADSSRLSNYGFRMQFDSELVSRATNDLGLNAAYATSCQRFYINTDTAVSIEVITQANFDNSHPAGSSINDLVFVRPLNGIMDTVLNPYLPLAQALTIINEKGSFGYAVDFRFKPSTPFLSQQQFQVSVICASGRQLQGSTSIRFY